MGFFGGLFGGGTLSKDAFAKEVQARMQKAGERRSMTFESARFQIVFGDMTKGEPVNILNLHNFYAQYEALPPKDRERVFQDILSMQREPHELTFAEARFSILPRVRERIHASLIAKQVELQFTRANPNRPPMKPFSLPHQALGEHFGVNLCIDYPTTVVDVTAADFEGWKVSFDEVMAAALENLRAISKEPFKEASKGVFVSTWRDSHDPARLLLTDVISKLPLKGRPVATIPERNALIITGSEDAAGLSELVALTKMGLKDPRPLAGYPLELVDGVWRPFVPAGNSPVEVELKVLKVQAELGAHAEQKQVLTDWHAVKEVDIFVATFQAMRRQETGEIRTHCTWTEGVSTLLPATDDVSLVQLDDAGGDPKVQVVPFAVLKQIAGHRMVEVPGAYPARYEVQSFPSEQERARLSPQ